MTPFNPNRGWDYNITGNYNRNADGGSIVPDGGLTAMLLGMGMLGLGWVRRMVK
jgi:hypothetical protein